jgi:transposase
MGMEATGGHEDALATHLLAAGRRVRVVNLARVRYAGLVPGRGNKVGKAD